MNNLGQWNRKESVEIIEEGSGEINREVKLIKTARELRTLKVVHERSGNPSPG